MGPGRIHHSPQRWAGPSEPSMSPRAGPRLVGTPSPGSTRQRQALGPLLSPGWAALGSLWRLGLLWGREWGCQTEGWGGLQVLGGRKTKECPAPRGFQRSREMREETVSPEGGHTCREMWGQEGDTPRREQEF